MSIGQRIEQKRKELGWSQEDLGNKLNVSRQSVYKWESDQAIPELEKVIILCQLFDVSIDWLLSGRNPEAKAEEPEKIVIKEKQVPWIYKISFVILAVALIIGSIRLRNIEQNYSNLQNHIENIRYDTQMSIAGISESIKRTLDNYSNAVLDYDIDIVASDYRAETLTFSVDVMPKIYSEGMSVKVQITSVDQEGKSFVSDVLAEDKGNGCFDALIEANFTDDINIMCILINGDVRENVILQNFSGLRSESFEYYDFGWPFISYEISSDGKHFDRGYCSILHENFEPYYSDIKFELKRAKTANLSVSLYTKDGEKICVYKLLEGKPDNLITNETNVIYFERPEYLELDPDKQYKEVLTITDEYGRTMTKETY